MKDEQYLIIEMKLYLLSKKLQLYNLDPIETLYKITNVRMDNQFYKKWNNTRKRLLLMSRHKRVYALHHLMGYGQTKTGKLEGMNVNDVKQYIETPPNYTVDNHTKIELDFINDKLKRIEKNLKKKGFNLL